MTVHLKPFPLSFANLCRKSATVMLPEPDGNVPVAPPDHLASHENNGRAPLHVRSIVSMVAAVPSSPVARITYFFITGPPVLDAMGAPTAAAAAATAANKADNHTVVNEMTGMVT
jgi:hypothetical protein